MAAWICTCLEAVECTDMVRSFFRRFFHSIVSWTKTQHKSSQYPPRELPDLSNENTQRRVKFEFQTLKNDLLVFKSHATYTKNTLLSM